MNGFEALDCFAGPLAQMVAAVVFTHFLSPEALGVYGSVTAPVLLTGLWLWMGFELKGGWLHYKATLAAGLFAYALHCRRILLDMKSGHNLRTVGWLKVFAHGQILVLVAMVVLAVFKPF